MSKPNTIDTILLDIVIEDAPDDLSGRYPTCPPTGCWSHKNKPHSIGYRLVSASGKHRKLHRIVYEHLRETIPEGLDLDHLCRNRGCCNPDHLEPVSRQVNLLRGETSAAAYAAKTHCPQGHPYSGDNLHINASRNSRVCKTCRRERQRNYDRAKSRARG